VEYKPITHKPWEKPIIAKVVLLSEDQNKSNVCANEAGHLNLWWWLEGFLIGEWRLRLLKVLRASNYGRSTK